MTFTSPALPLAVALLVAPLAVVLQSKAMAPIGLVALALCVVAHIRMTRVLPWPRGAALWLAVALGAWGMASAVWAAEPGRALTTGASVAAMALLAGGAAQALHASDDTTRSALTLCIAIGLCIGLAAAAIDAVTGNAIRAAVRGLAEAPATLAFGLKPAASVMALLLPLAFALPWPALLRALLLLGGAGVLVALPGDTAKLAALLGLAVGTATIAAPRLVPRLVGAGLAAAILAMPMFVAAIPSLPVERLPITALHRMLIWDFTADRIAERPIIGWGLEASRTVPGGRDAPPAAQLDRMRVTDTEHRRWFGMPSIQVLPLHPHNGALQIWLELGAIGALIAAALAWCLGTAATRSPCPPAAAGALASAAVTAMLSFGVWQAWWVVAMLLAAAVCAGLVRCRGEGSALPEPHPPRA
ncbi:O-antigen ligase family protein [Roseomonas fluvialis]|uniref:O-antigen ligase family protein n=1 Tax=Roseomonas fluvialis TaxID=1750527 RepID=UPI001FCDFCC7|nr:O-antigen ligase family protein [Roseomonas fluvialis]